MMSILTVTRKRPDFYKRMNTGALELADKPELLEFITYRDDDDLTVYEYSGDFTEIVGERILYANMWNECYKRAKYDIIFQIPDDFNIYTKGWDTVVYQTFEQYPDKIVLVWPNDRRYRSRFSSIFWLHRNWIDTVGYAAPPYYSAYGIDEWWFDVSQTLGRNHYLREVLIKHDWAGEDETHTEYMERRNRDKRKRLYSSPDIMQKRAEDVKKLQEFIDNYGTG